MNFLGIDMGGTTVKYSLIDEKGNMSNEGDFLTASKDADELMQKIIKIAQEYKEKFDIKGIGISCPGVIHPYDGYALWANANMPLGWHEIRIKESLEKTLSIPVVADNDVNCAAMGEKWLGAGKDYHTFICIAMGTGIGSGIVINNNLYYGANYQAGEVGYLHSNKGTTRFWEKEASTLALVRRIKEIAEMMRIFSQEEIEKIDGKWIFEHYSKDERIRMAVDDWADILASGIADVICVLNPQVVILGGGVSAQDTVLLDLVVPRVKAILPCGFHSDVLIAKTGNKAGQLGSIRRLLNEEFTNK